MTFDKLPYMFLQWLVFLCVALHNLEEGVTAEAYFPKGKELLMARVPPTLLAAVPTLDQFYIALLGQRLYLSSSQ